MNTTEPVWEFLRNDKLDAVPYDFASATRSATNPPPVKAPYRQNQYGYELGGPDSDSEDSSTERTGCSSCRTLRNTTRARPLRRIITTLPQAMRNGDFSSLLSSGFTLL